ncbi:MAG: SAM-dependent DNA methyltransferase [Bacteroidota bacterium]|jgi:hypothetical protein
MTDKQVKSKQRVADHGEVFTNEREVKAMLDLVKHETERIESRFLEPACGNGNFLAEVLRRKLDTVDFKYGHSQSQWERYAVLAVTSIYGVDILADNAMECRERLLGIFQERYARQFSSINPDCLRSVKYILDLNIMHGDALDLKNPDTHNPLIFAEWSPVNSVLLKRRDFTMDKLMRPRSSSAHDLLSDLGEEAFIPQPVAEYPLIHFLKLGDNADNQLQS